MAERDDVDDATIELGRMAMGILKGKDRDAMQEIIARNNPEVVFPEVNARKAVESATKPLQEKIQKMEEAREKEARLQEAEARRKPLRDKGLGDEEIKKVEKFMTDNHVYNYEIAHRLMTEAEQMATPRAPRGRFEVPKAPTKDDGKPMTALERQKSARDLAHSLIDQHLMGKSIA